MAAAMPNSVPPGLCRRRATLSWPRALPVNEAAVLCSLPFFIQYADKRARHDSFVSLESRFEDLLDRYGTTEDHRKGIRASYLQAKAIEEALSRHLGMDLRTLKV